MKMKIEFYENGLSFDLESNTIIKSNGDVETLSHNNIEDVRWCIRNNKDFLNTQLENIRKRLRRIEIEPLTEKQKNVLEVKMEDIYNEIEFFNSIELHFKEFLNEEIYFTYSRLGQPFFLRNGDKDCSDGICSRDWKPNELRLIADYIEKNPNCILFHDGSGKIN